MLNFFLATTEESVSGLALLLPQVIPLVALVGVMYFMIFRPQRKKEKTLKLMLAELKVGDDIVTIGGIVGKVSNIKDDIITIETGNEKNKMKVQRWAIKEVN